MKNKIYKFRIKIQLTLKSKQTNKIICLFFDSENEADSYMKKMNNCIFVSKKWIIQVLNKKIFFFKKWIEVRQLVNNLNIIDINLRSRIDAEILLNFYRLNKIEFTGYYFLTHVNSKLTKVEELIHNEFEKRNKILFIPNSWCRFIFNDKKYIGRTCLIDSSKEIHYLCENGSTGLFIFELNILNFYNFGYLDLNI